MSMTAATMAQNIVDNLKVVNADIDAAQETLLLAHWEPVCQGIIDEIVAAAVIATTVSGGSSAGVHVGTVTS